MIITKEIIKAIEQGKDKVKRIEANFVAPEFREDSTWLKVINGVIDRTALAVRDELERVK